MQHTPTPWTITRMRNKLYLNRAIPNDPSKSVCFELQTEEYEGELSELDLANAEFAMTAINAHDDLVEALQLMLKKDAAMREHFNDKWPIDLSPQNARKHALAALKKAGIQ